MVQGEGHRAVGAHRLLPALAAQEAGGVAAPVEEDEALLAPLEARGERLAQRSGSGSGRPPPRSTARRSTISTRGRPLRADAARAGASRWYLPLQRVRVRLDRGRRRARGRPGSPRAGPASRPRRARGSAGSRPACRTPSCSSSTTIRPSSGTGAKTAERAPTTTRASPSRMRHHWSCRSPAESSLCRTDTVARSARAAARTSIGRQRDLGHQHDRARGPARAPPRRRGSRPRSCRCPVTPCSRNGRNAAARHAPRRRLASAALLVRRGRDGASAPRSGSPSGARTLALRRRGAATPFSREALERPAQRRPVPRQVGHARAPAGGPQALERPRPGPAPRRERRRPPAPPPAPRGSPARRSPARPPRAPRGAAAPRAPAGRGPSRFSRVGQPQRARPQRRDARDRPGSRRRSASRTTARLARTPGGRQHQAVALAGRREVVLGHPGREVEQRRRRRAGSRRGPAATSLSSRPPSSAARRAGHDPDHPAAAERHQHAHAALGHRRSPAASGR